MLLLRNNWKFSYLFWGGFTWWVTSFSYSNASSWGFGEGYEVYVEDEVPYLKVIIKNLAFRAPEFSWVDKINDWEYTETFELEPSILEGMQKLANKHKIWRREGHYVDKRVLDGDSWGFLMKFGDGKYISAHGYMAGPKGFYEWMGEFLALFEREYVQTREKADALLESLQNF